MDVIWWDWKLGKGSIIKWHSGLGFVLGLVGISWMERLDGDGSYLGYLSLKGTLHRFTGGLVKASGTALC